MLIDIEYLEKVAAGLRVKGKNFKKTVEDLGADTSNKQKGSAYTEMRKVHENFKKRKKEEFEAKKQQNNTSKTLEESKQVNHNTNSSSSKNKEDDARFKQMRELEKKMDFTSPKKRKQESGLNTIKNKALGFLNKFRKK